MPEENPPPSRYEMVCFNCKIRFDAMEAVWCSCLSSASTLVCPHCLTCFCQAPQPYKSAFWESAPPELWKRRMDRKSEVFAPKPPPSPESVKRPLILVVEDEKEIQKMASLAIEGLGYSMILATNGQEGLDLAVKYRPDLVLTDALMPKLDGRHMCKRIKENPQTSAIKVVIMTSVFTAGRYKTEALWDFRADEYLAKPLEFKSLQALLRRFLD